MRGLCAPRVTLGGRDSGGGLHAQLQRQLGQRSLLVVRGHVRHQRQVLDQAAALALWRVRWAEHAPLARLQRAWARHLRSAASAASTHACGCLHFAQGLTLPSDVLLKRQVIGRFACPSQAVWAMRPSASAAAAIWLLLGVYQVSVRTFRVFSNWLLMRVIMPSAAMNDSRDSTCSGSLFQ